MREPRCETCGKTETQIDSYGGCTRNGGAPYRNLVDAQATYTKRYTERLINGVGPLVVIILLLIWRRL